MTASHLYAEVEGSVWIFRVDFGGIRPGCSSRQSESPPKCLQPGLLLQSSMLSFCPHFMMATSRAHLWPHYPYTATTATSSGPAAAATPITREWDAQSLLAEAGGNSGSPGMTSSICGIRCRSMSSHSLICGTCTTGTCQTPACPNPYFASLLRPVLSILIPPLPPFRRSVLDEATGAT